MANIEIEEQLDADENVIDKIATVTKEVVKTESFRISGIETEQQMEELIKEQAILQKKVDDLNEIITELNK
jgi:phosphoglucomutase